jgi:hypothetical protein
MVFHGLRSVLPGWLLPLIFSASFASVVSGCGGGSGTGTTPNPPSNPTPPAITSVAPATIPAGSAAFTLQINGSGFVSGSTASWNGTSLTTTYVSATELKAGVPASLAAIGGSFAIAVANPDGQSSGSSHPSVVVDNPVPSITSLSPASVTAGSGALSVVVTGKGFLPSSIASFAGNARPTTVQSSSQLTMALTAADLANPGSVNVTVANPAPGGGASAPATFTLLQPPPVILGITPTTLIVGSQDTLITITGTGFTANAIVFAGGSELAPASATPTTITVTIPGYLLNNPGTLQLAVVTPVNISNSVTLNLLNPLPAIQSISPQIVTAGSPGFGVTIQATGLLPNTQVNLNGSPAAGPFSASIGFIQVSIPASALAQVGTITISLTNPAPGGGTSNVATVQVIAGSNYLRTVNLPANALVWNPQQQVIYAAIPAGASSNASSIVAIDPTSGNIVASQTMPGEPNLLAISGDQQYLYVGITATATVLRLNLPSLTTDIQWSVGPTPPGNDATSIYDMQVAPGLPHTLGVTQETASQGSTSELAIYDDGVLRPNTGTAVIQPIGYVNLFTWGADGSAIYATENTESGGPDFIYSVDAQGATLTGTNLGAFGGGETQLIYDPNENRLYDSEGDVVDPATGTSLGSFPASAASFAIDSTQHRVYFMGGAPFQSSVNTNGVAQIAVFDQDHFTAEGVIELPAVAGAYTAPANGAACLIRWGTAGLAFNAGSNIYILDGPFVTPGALPASTTGTYATPPPQLSGLSPESVVAGSPDVTITITGQNFTTATTVSWNNNNLATTIVSNTQVQAVIPAAALTAPASEPLYVENGPGEGTSNLLAFSVLPNLGTGMQFTTLNLAGSDLVWNAANNLLYVAVNNTDSLHPQTMAVVDPVAGAVQSALPLSANPYVLAISGDDQELFTGFTNYANVQRYALPALTPDLLIPLGIGAQNGNVPGGTLSCDFAVSLAVAPGSNSTFAVIQGSSDTEPKGCGATAVIDAATPRPVTPPVIVSGDVNFSELTWGADATALYAQGDPCCSFQPISSLTVSSTGVVFNQAVTTDIYLGYRPHFDAATSLVYSDGGAISDPSTLAMVGNFQASGLMVPDSTLGLAYFLGQTQSQVGGNYGQGNADYTLQIYNLNTYALINSIVIPNVIGYPVQLIRWGAQGIAFVTNNGDNMGTDAPGLTYILSGPEIASTTPALQKTPAQRVHFTWAGRMHHRRAESPR